MEIKYYWQRQQIEHGYLQFNYIPSAENAADGLTKPLELNPFKAFRNNLMHMRNNYIEPKSSIYSSSD